MFPGSRNAVAGALLACTLALGVLPPRPAAAQEVLTAEVPHRTPRRKVFAVAGAVIGAAAGIGYAKASQSGLHGGCFGIQCVIVASTAGGTLFGYFIGREYDLTYAQRYRGVAPLRPPSISVGLQGEPVALALNDSVIAVGGSAGVQLFTFAGGAGLAAQATRAGGLRGISVVSLAPGPVWLTVGSPSGLYLFPPGRGPGALMRTGDVSAAASSAERVYFGVDSRIEVAPLRADTTGEWPWVAVAGGGTARDLAFDAARGVLWAVTDRALLSYRVNGDSLALLGRVPLDGAGRRVAVRNDTIAVALGEQGLRLYEAHDPRAPRRIASWGVAHFVYDVSMDKGRIFVAAGPEGVYVIEVQKTALVTLGLARGLGFAAALASRDGYTYILDRRGNALRRITSDF